MANQLNIPELKVTDDRSAIIRNQNAANKQMSSKLIRDYAILSKDIKELSERSVGSHLPFTLKANTYIIAEDGSEVAYSGWSSTDFIDVSGVDYISAFGVTGPWSCWYKEDKTFLSNHEFNGAPVKVPYGAKYLRLSQADSIMNNLIVTGEATSLMAILAEINGRLQALEKKVQ